MIRNMLSGVTMGILALLVLRPAAANHFEYLAADPARGGAPSWVYTRADKHWAIDGTLDRWCSDDSGAGQTQLRQLFSANVFAAWEPALPITDWGQDCGVYELYIRVYPTDFSGDCGGNPACYNWNPWWDNDRLGYYAAGGQILINDADWDWEASGLIAVANHEMGHHYGLHEQYTDDGSQSQSCGVGPPSVMDAPYARPGTNIVYAGCESNYPTATDIARVQAFYDVAPATLPTGSQGSVPQSVTWSWEDDNWSESQYIVNTYRAAGTQWNLVNVDQRAHGVAPGRPVNQFHVSSTYTLPSEASAGWHMACIQTNNAVVGTKPSSPPCTQVVFLDFDNDGDGVRNTQDNCDFVPNANQANSDTDAFGDACDNCPQTSNPDQANNDGDSMGDVCDPDDDNDGVLDLSDNCQFAANQNQANSDSDTRGNVCDNCPQTSNSNQADYDRDGIPGTQPATPTPPAVPGQFGGDSCDPDDDADGFTDVAEAGAPLCQGAPAPNNVNDDNLDDSYVNDGCPAVNAAESACTGSADDDSDTYVNDGCLKRGSYSEADFRIGTNTLLSCGVGAETGFSNGWPSDFVSGRTPSSTDKINIYDLSTYLVPPAERRIGTSPGNGPYSSRWDLVPGPQVFTLWINANDITALTGANPAVPTNYPPMLGGSRAWSGPPCHEPPFP